MFFNVCWESPWRSCCCWLAFLLLPKPPVLPQFGLIDDEEAVTKNFAGQNLIRSEFSDAKLESANFEGADLRGAVFNGAILKNANLHRVDFSDGIAYVSSFVGADLTDAVLTSAMLLKSNFRDAKITGADFSLAMLDRSQMLMLCKTASGINPVTQVDTRESLGCK